MSHSGPGRLNRKSASPPVVRWNYRVGFALFGLALAGLVVGVAFASVRRGVEVAAWLGNVGLAFIIAANAHAEESPVRRIAQRFAVSLLVLPAVFFALAIAPGWLFMPIVLSACTLALIGPRAFREIWDAVSSRTDV